MFACCRPDADPITTQKVEACADDQAPPLFAVENALSQPATKTQSLDAQARRASLQSSTRTFGVVVTKASFDEPWGLNLELVAKSGVWISMVSEDSGAVARYNQSAGLEKRICSGDIILEANGERQPAKIAKIMQQPTLTLVLKRPREFEVNLKSNGKPLGLEFSHQEHGNGLYVKAIAEDSPILSCGADLALGDRIVAVNGRRGACQEMLEELKCGSPQVTVARL